MTEQYTLNIGSGERTYKEYPPGSGFKCINYDERNIPGHTDVTGDIRRLPWADGYFSYILASDVIEHAPISETNKILTEWKRVLKVGEVIEFRLPNLAAICKKYIDGKHDAKLTSWLLFGGQDYSGNFHYVGFDREFFRAVVTPVGFVEVEYKDTDNNFEVKYKKI